MLNDQATGSPASRAVQNQATTGGLPLSVSETSEGFPPSGNDPIETSQSHAAMSPTPATLSGGKFKVSDTPEPLLPPAAAKVMAPLEQWSKVVADLAAEIKVRHYSPKTLKTYTIWTRQFQFFIRNKDIEQLSSADVKEYMKFLAVTRRVSASSQNQAFNALLFLFRHVVKKDFGNHKDNVRAKQTKYIPVVLSKAEIDSVINNLSHPYSLAVKLLYGCGLRCLSA